MAFLHLNGILHRDLKSPNLLIDDVRLPLRPPVSGSNINICLFTHRTDIGRVRRAAFLHFPPQDLHIKMTDFGFSTTKSRSRGVAQLGTPCWMAPEVFAGSKFTDAADCYSFGIVLWELAAWEAPYASLGEEQVRAHVAAGLRPEVGLPNVRAAPEQLVALMAECWAQRCDCSAPHSFAL